MKSHIAAVIFILLSPIAQAAEDYSAKVVGISDGDTITVLTAEKKQVKIRLHGIDAPETGQDFGSKAKQAASEMAFGKQVTVKPVDTDRYGRTVAEVVLPDGKSLNREMVEQGMAWYYRQYKPDDVILNRAEVCAKKSHLGLWSQPNPTPPWDWRHGKNVPVTAEVIGNRNSHVYHAPHCTSVGRMKEENKVTFKSAAEAEEKGYHKAGDCK
jgi:endonuclease YncB( thermonuclease family)